MSLPNIGTRLGKDELMQHALYLTADEKLSIIQEVQKSLAVDPAKRLGKDELMQHALNLTADEKLSLIQDLQKSLAVDPAKRQRPSDTPRTALGHAKGTESLLARLKEHAPVFKETSVDDYDAKRVKLYSAEGFTLKKEVYRGGQLLESIESNVFPAGDVFDCTVQQLTEQAVTIVERSHYPSLSQPRIQLTIPWDMLDRLCDLHPKVQFLEQDD